jgi:2-polyprenyl-3-methyl-5-hydroxy-6-metoxy-1,4-benzoquinol methylase
MHPMPSKSELERIYQSFEQSYPMSKLSHEDSDFSAFANDRYEFVASKIDLDNPLRILEVGSSYGLFLKRFNQSFHNLHGIEPSKRPALHSQSQFGLKNIQNCMLEDAKLTKASFDLICSFHVIEHLRDPLSMLKKMRDLIKDTGRLFIATPNLSVLNPNIIQYHFLYRGLHLTLFTPGTISSALGKAGFTIIDCHQEKNRTAESGSMIIEAKPGKEVTKVSHKELQYGRKYINAIRDMQKHLKNQFKKWTADGLKIAIYGAGAHTKGVFDCLQEQSAHIKLIYDDDKKKSGKTISGIPIKSFATENLHGIDLILVSSLAAEKKIIDKVRVQTENTLKCYGIYRDILKKEIP